MAITVQEKFDSQEIAKDQAQRTYLVSGTDWADAAKAQVDTLLGGSTFDAKPYSHCQVEYYGPATWKAQAYFIDPEKAEKPIGESSYEFDTTGGTQHITQSKFTTMKFAPPGKVAPDFGGAIGVTKDSVDGCDITVPVYAFSETHVLADAAVTPQYKAILFALTGKVNDAMFKGLNPQECLFLGATGSKRGSGAWEITYRFAGNPSVDGITIGDIVNVSKLGWEYLWVRYQDVEDANAKSIVKRPQAAYTEKVYDSANFALLGIGT
ncbi:MAG: hypothetical protein ABFD92_07895 [Planctomycetaceae bacterium]|nr:hypothetical protein [Planctomycetaceae bacterium]